MNTLHKRSVVDCTLVAPPCAQSGSNLAVIPLTPCPFNQGFRDSIDSQETRSMAITLLRYATRPSQIALLIVSVVVDTVKRMRHRRALADNLNQFFQRLNFAFDATPPVSSVAVIIRVTTPVLKALPNSVFGCVALPVRGDAFAHPVSLQTSTRLRVALSQASRSSQKERATLAFAQPSRVTSFRGGIGTVNTQYGEPSKELASQINLRTIWGKWYGKIQNRHFNLLDRLKSLEGLSA